MPSSAAEVQSITLVSDILYDFLPGTPHPRANPRISFPGAASAAGVVDFWTGGSKRPAITTLLQRTYAERRGRFCGLILEIVNAALVYRRNKTPLTRSDVEKLNTAVKRLGFKIPELWDPEFLASLSQNEMSSPEFPPEAAPVALSDLKRELLRMGTQSPQERGYAFERFLNDLFAVFKMTPRLPYRLRGEQIDGSFVDDQICYLVEAKWQSDKVGVSELRSFLGAVESKADWSRGCFISYSGFSADGVFAFTHGKATRVICVDGEDLFHVVDAKVHLRDVIRSKARHAAERGEAFVPTRDLFLNVT